MRAEAAPRRKDASERGCRDKGTLRRNSRYTKTAIDNIAFARYGGGDDAARPLPPWVCHFCVMGSFGSECPSDLMARIAVRTRARAGDRGQLQFGGVLRILSAYIDAAGQSL